MYLPQNIIAKKRDGKWLTDNEIKFFVEGLISNKFNDAQVGAMAMAIFQQGLTDNETIYLTQSMMSSGKILKWHNLNGPVVDKHSTGGVGDKVSFILASIIAACGAFVPMISGRGLGHTGGTVDKLESIVGYNVQPSLCRFKHIVKDVGMAIISQTPELAPADKRLYAIRDITATVASIPLITASILSKKLAAGIDMLVMDIKIGNGAMMTNISQAHLLANNITNIAKGAGVNTQAIITDMNQVLGSTAGNSLEIYESVNYLTGKQREERLHKVVMNLASAILINSKIVNNLAEAQLKIETVLASGYAAEIFEKMVHGLGGPIDILNNPWRSMKTAKHIVEIKAPKKGYIEKMDTLKIGFTIVTLGGGRVRHDQKIDHSVGFDSILPIGTHVERSDVIAKVHANTKESANFARQEYIKALSISNEPVDIPKVIY
mgnify:CR=1 FL=1